jgi:hypothetical protein
MASVFFWHRERRKTHETSCKVVVNYYCYLVVFDVVL